VGVVPYRRDVFTDGILPTKLMEYASLGLAVIAVRTPVIDAYFDADMVEAIPAGDAGALAEALLQLARDPERRAALARNIRRFNERYSWAKQSAEYVALVQRLGSRGAHPAR
jgi:glycosyltransferase involved in cell wall biosynthesis